MQMAHASRQTLRFAKQYPAAMVRALRQQLLRCIAGTVFLRPDFAIPVFVFNPGALNILMKKSRRMTKRTFPSVAPAGAAWWRAGSSDSKFIMSSLLEATSLDATRADLMDRPDMPAAGDTAAGLPHRIGP
jgi:hypothetical protein